MSPSVVSLERKTHPERQMVFNLETENRRAHLLKRQLWIQPGGWRVIKLLCLCDVSTALISPRKLFPCRCLVLAVAPARVIGPYDLRALPVGLKAESVKSFWHVSCEADSPHNCRPVGLRPLYIQKSVFSVHLWQAHSECGMTGITQSARLSCQRAGESVFFFFFYLTV